MSADRKMPQRVFDSKSYGCPSKLAAPAAPSTPSAPTVDTSGLLFSAWPTAETRARAPQQKRTVCISNLPEAATYADLTATCRNTGIIERFQFCNGGKALVHFFDQETADKFLARTGNGLEYKKTVVYVDPALIIDVLSGRLREAIETGARRMVRIVGIEGVEQLVDAMKECCPEVRKEDWEGQDESAVLKTFAQQFGAFDVEMAGVKKNNAGFKEGRILFCKIDAAMKVFARLKKCVTLEGCNITYANDPCEN